MIPGPIEFEPEVYEAMNVPTKSHVAPDFIESFGKSLEMMKEVWQCPNGQAFIIAGTGTLAMDLAGANLIESGDKALVISTGYFGERYADLLKRYGAEVVILRAPLGKTVPLDIIEDELDGGDYKLMTFTHVDTSTAVLNDPKPLGALGTKYNVLTILDGVCSVAGEEIRQEEWGIDVVLTASQKAIGVPPGLALLVVSQKAIATWENRETLVGNYYADWNNWLAIMKAYEARKPSYFGTPAVNLVLGLEASLKKILEEGLAKRFQRHQDMSSLFRKGLDRMGLTMIPEHKDAYASTLSAIYYPDGVDGGKFISKINEAGVIVAGGLLSDLKSKYFRVGHMGRVNIQDVETTLSAIQFAVDSCSE